MKTLPKPGTYTGRLAGIIAVGLVQDYLVADIPYVLTDSDVAQSGVHRAFLVKPDGTPYDRTIEDLKLIFGDFEGPWDLMELKVEEGKEVLFTLSNCEHQTYKDKASGEEKTVFKSGFINPLGGGGAPKVAAGDRKELIARFGAIFKAKGKPTAKPAATASAKPVAAAKPAPAPAKAASSGPPSRSTAPAAPVSKSSQDEVWNKLCEKYPDEGQDVVGKMFFEAQDKVREGANQDFTPEEWGQIAAVLEV